MRNLYFYSGINPNKNEHTHVFFNDVANYLAYLNDYFVTSLDSDNYRINGGVVKSKGLLADYSTITYVVEIEQDPLTGAFRYFKAYHVDKSEVVGGYSVFRLSVDLWASNMPYATFGDIHVSRCNRNIGQGIYDQIANDRVVSSSIVQPLDDTTITANDIVAVVTANAVTNVVESWAGVKSEIKQDYTLCVELSQIIEIIKTPGGAHSAHGANVIEAVTRYLSNVYGVATTSGTRGFLDCKISNIYFLPITAVNYGDGLTGIHLKSKDPYNNSDIPDILAWICKPEIRRLYKTISDYDIDYNYYVGCEGNATPLKRYVNPFSICFAFSISQNVSVSLIQGNAEYDITKAFEAPIVGTANDLDALQEQAREQKAFYDSIAQTLKTLTASISGGALGGGTLLTKQLGAYWGALDRAPTQAEAINGKGDALISYTRGIPRQEALVTEDISAPLVFVKYKSLRDERERAYFEGASFDMYINAFSDITRAPRLGYKKGDPLGNDTFIVADAEVIGVQADAEAFIKSELMKGIYYLYV